MSRSETESGVGVRTGDRTYVRTNVRTNGEQLSPTRDTSSSVTRTRTYGIFPGCWFHPKARLHDCADCRAVVTE